MTASLARILIVEDDRTLATQLGELLRGQGYATSACHLGEAGLETALREAPDLLLLDVMLPDVNGFSVLRRLREQQQTPVIMLTACGAEEERIRGLRHGADDYLPKPFNITELQLRIDAVLRRTRSQEGTRGGQAQQLQVDELHLDRHAQQARVGDCDLALSKLKPPTKSLALMAATNCSATATAWLGCGAWVGVAPRGGAVVGAGKTMGGVTVSHATSAAAQAPHCSQ